MINLANVVRSPYMASAFTILRDAGGTYVQGKYVEGTQISIPATGVITPASSIDIQMLQESDRVTGMILVATTTPLFETTTGPPAITADIIVYLGKQYRIARLMPLLQFGFNKAIAGLMGGG